MPFAFSPEVDVEGTGASLPPPGGTGRKRKRLVEEEESSSESASESSSSDTKKMRFSDVDDGIKCLSPQVLEENRRKLKTGFKLFQLVQLQMSKKKKSISADEMSKAWNDLDKHRRTYYQQQIKKLFAAADQVWPFTLRFYSDSFFLAKHNVDLPEGQICGCQFSSPYIVFSF